MQGRLLICKYYMNPVQFIFVIMSYLWYTSCDIVHSESRFQMAIDHNDRIRFMMTCMFGSEYWHLRHVAIFACFKSWRFYLDESVFVVKRGDSISLKSTGISRFCDHTLRQLISPCMLRLSVEKLPNSDSCLTIAQLSCSLCSILYEAQQTCPLEPCNISTFSHHP